MAASVYYAKGESHRKKTNRRRAKLSGLELSTTSLREVGLESETNVCGNQ